MRIISFLVILAIIVVALLGFCKNSCERELTDKEIIKSIRGCSSEAKYYIMRADKDFKAGHLRLFHFGLGSEGTFNEYYMLYLEKYKDINILGAGCMVDSFLLIYNTRMINDIELRYGSNYFKECVNSTRKIYGNRIRDRQPYWAP